MFLKNLHHVRRGDELPFQVYVLVPEIVIQHDAVKAVAHSQISRVALLPRLRPDFYIEALHEFRLQPKRTTAKIYSSEAVTESKQGTARRTDHAKDPLQHLCDFGLGVLCLISNDARRLNRTQA